VTFKASRLAAIKQATRRSREIRREINPLAYVILCNRCRNRFKLADIDDNGDCPNCRGAYGISKGT
jgi:hypothetical protein